MGDVPHQQQPDHDDAQPALATAAEPELEGAADSGRTKHHLHDAKEALHDKKESAKEVLKEKKESAKAGADKAAVAAKSSVAVGAMAATVAAGAAAPAAAATATEASAAAAADTQAPASQPAAQKQGANQFKKMCGDSKEGACKAPKWSEENLTFDAVVASRKVNTTWPEIKIIGGWRPSDPFPDHPSGKALDIMMPNGGSGSDKELGTQIAKFFQDHADEYGVDYILWRQKSWTAAKPKKGWESMADRGSPTANHVDHVHITFHGNKNKVAQELIDSVGAAGSSAKPGLPGADAAQSINEVENSKTVVKTLFHEDKG